MRPKFIITLSVIVLAFLIALFTFKHFTKEDALLVAENTLEETTGIYEEPITNPEIEMPTDPGQASTEPSSEEYDYSAPEGIFDNIEEIKDEYTGRPDYIYDQTNVEIAKNFGIYETGKNNPFSEIYSLESYTFDKSVIIPNESN